MEARNDPMPSPLVQDRLGLATLTRKAFQGYDLANTASDLLINTTRNPNDAGSLMDLSIIEQLKGNLQSGLNYQLAAFHKCQLFRTIANRKTHLRLLILAAPIHMGGNTPVEFLLENSDIEIITLYVVPGMPLPDPIPEHDLAFVAAPGDSGITLQFLKEIERITANWPVPVLNNPTAIEKLERDTVCDILADVSGILIPKTIRMKREEILEFIRLEESLGDILPRLSFPLIIRPVGSHAGRGLECLTNLEELASCMHHQQEAEFFLSRFIDYSSSDGAFRKYRIVFIDGQAFPVHMAIADEWKVWYMNANMDENASKRHEEERFMREFDSQFAKRHKRAFSSLCKAIDLEYFGIDCAEDKDGNLIIFEVDNALIVHDMDPVDIYPYKPIQMHRLFEAFSNMIHAKNYVKKAYEAGRLYHKWMPESLRKLSKISDTKSMDDYQAVLEVAENTLAAKNGPSGIFHTLQLTSDDFWNEYAKDEPKDSGIIN